MIKIFEYHQELDCFVVNPVYKQSHKVGQTGRLSNYWIKGLMKINELMGIGAGTLGGFKTITFPTSKRILGVAIDSLLPNILNIKHLTNGQR